MESLMIVCVCVCVCVWVGVCVEGGHKHWSLLLPHLLMLVTLTQSEPQVNMLKQVKYEPYYYYCFIIITIAIDILSVVILTAWEHQKHIFTKLQLKTDWLLPPSVQTDIL